MVSPFCGNQSNLPWPQTLAKQSIAQTCIFPNFLALCFGFYKNTCLFRAALPVSAPWKSFWTLRGPTCHPNTVQT